MNAAYLWAQLENMDIIQEKRLSVWNRYKEGLTELADKEYLEFGAIPEECTNNAHMFYFKVKDLDTRTDLIKYLKEKGIMAVFHYVPLHSAPAGRKFGRFNGEDRFTTKESERLIRLPLFYSITDEEINRVIETLREYFY